MKILQILIAVVALMMTLQVGATTVSHAHGVYNWQSADGVKPDLSNLFGSFDAGHFTHDYRSARLSHSSHHYSRTTDLRDLAGFLRDSRKREDFLLIREQWKSHAKGFSGAGNGEAIPMNTGPVSAVPVPAAIWLLGSGIAGLFAFAYRRKV